MISKQLCEYHNEGLPEERIGFNFSGSLKCTAHQIIFAHFFLKSSSFFLFSPQNIILFHLTFVDMGHKYV